MVAEFHRAVSQDPRSEVVLAAHDILEFDRLFDLLGICEAHNKRVRLVSPGLRLADMAFARRLAPRISSFTITYLSHDADTYHRMTGNPQAQAQVQLTLQHLKALRVHVMVNYVVTRYNHRDLLGVAGYLLDQMGLDAFDLVMLIPEKGHADLGHDVGALLAPFPELNRELVRFTRRYHGTSKRLSLIDVPPCQVTEEALTSGILSFSPAPPDADLVRRVSYQSCASCHFASRCPRVFDAYLQRYPAEPVDVEKVNRNHHLLCDSSPPWGSGS